MIDINLHVHEGKIIGKGHLDLLSKRGVDAKELFLLPSMIDAYVHFVDLANTTKEDFPTSRRAGSVARVTRVIEHNQGGFGL
jgi:dihydroorotase-like cyclic amidohydrolase